MISRYILCFFLCFSFFQNSTLANSRKTPAPSSIMGSCIGAAGSVDWLIYENIPSSQLDRLFHAPAFPQSPTRVKKITELSTPSRYNDNFGGMVRGFIRAPETGDYRFNLTGDDQSVFRISTDSLRENLVEVSSIPSWTDESQHDKYPEQTSDFVTLTAGEYYYFEAIYKEGGGGDFVRVHWRLPSNINGTTWTIIPGTVLYSTECEDICPPSGTSCDDGDATTINDMEDGVCNCQGTPQVLPYTCIGERGRINVLYYDGISSNQLDSLYNHPNYPLNPQRANVLTQFTNYDSAHIYDQYGTRVSAYLSVPESGYFQFNLTGADRITLRLSDSENTTTSDEIAYSPWGTGEYNHTQQTSQTSDSIWLDAGTFYAFEMNHKENETWDYFNVFWKTPWAQDTIWRLMDATFLYTYGCEMACIPEGISCDDGDPNTFGDAYDANCNCVGTPCADPECSNALGYIAYEECAEGEEHSNDSTDAWLSCQPFQNPNPARGIGHWIQYDFGMPYILNGANVWNYNAVGNTNLGFNEVSIDYSLDGITWTTLGDFNWNQANGNSEYTGFNFSQLSGISARYILITALSNFGGDNCYGISEIVFSADTCPDAGTTCDDGDPNTQNDVYDANCNCSGNDPSSGTLVNNCHGDNLIINNVISTGSYEMSQSITSAGMVEENTSVQFLASDFIVLQPGFVAKSGSDFIAALMPCENSQPLVGNENDLTNQNQNMIPRNADTTGGYIEKQSLVSIVDSLSEKPLVTGDPKLTIIPNPADSWTNINFYLHDASMVKLEILSATGQLVYTIAEEVSFEAGDHSKRIPAHRFEAGVYFVVLHTESGNLVERLVVISR